MMFSAKIQVCLAVVDAFLRPFRGLARPRSCYTEPRRAGPDDCKWVPVPYKHVIN